MKWVTNTEPRTLDEAVKQIMEGLEAKDIEAIKQEPEADVRAHHFLGQSLRNRWHLWVVTTPLVQHCRDTLRVGHADDISAIILATVVRKVREEPYDRDAHIRRIHAHWREAGCNEFGEVV